MGRPAILIHSAALSGAELSLVRFSHYLDGLDPVYVSLSAGPIIDRLRKPGRDVVVLDSDASSVALTRHAPWRDTAASARRLSRVARQLDGLDIGLLIPTSLKSGLVAIAARRHVRAPIVWWMHDRLTAEYMSATKSVAARLMVRTFSAGLVVNSTSTFEALGAPPLPTLHVPPAIERMTDVAHPERHRSARPGLTVAMVGRISAWKGQLTLVDALASLPEGTVSTCHLFGAPLFGEDDYLREVEAAVERAGLSDTVTIHGHVEDVARRLADVDVLVHASLIPEPFGAVVVEGLAAGCVVIASGAGGPAEVITDGIDGLLYPPGSAQALAAAILSVSNMPSERRVAMATRGMRSADRYAVDRLGPALADWLRSWQIGDTPNAWTDSVSRSV